MNRRSCPHGIHSEFDAECRRRAFSLIELLVVVSVVLIILGLALPAIGHARHRAREAAALASLRTISSTTWTYALAARDLPPTFFPPREGYFGRDDPHRVVVNGRSLSGYWFDHSVYYHCAFSPPLPRPVLLAPASTRTAVEHVENVQTRAYAEHRIASVFYAEPEFWTIAGQRSDRQWRPQPVSKVRFPSLKGLLYQHTVYNAPQMPPRYTVPNYPRGRGGVAWADHSATITAQADLRPGIPNTFDHYRATNWLLDGAPIDTTEQGVHGRDR